MSDELLLPHEVDRLLRYPKGRAQRLAKKNRLPSVVLPDGEIRFRKSDIDRLIIGAESTTGKGTAGAVGAHEDDTSEYTAGAADATYPELDDVEE